MGAILVSGSLVYDKIMDFPGRFVDHILPEKIHALSVNFVVDKVETRMGGTAGNIAYNLKLLGEEPIIFSQAGTDFGLYKKWLQQHHITVEGIRLVPRKETTVAYIITDRNDNQIAALHFTTMGTPCGITLNKVQRYVPVKMAIIAPGNTTDMIHAAQVYKRLGIPYIADPGQEIPLLSARELDYIMQGARVLISNDYEFSLIKRKLKLSDEVILRRMPIVVVTLGAQGSCIYHGTQKYTVKAVRPRRVVDPTGAGDAYRAGFIKGFINGWSLTRCGEFASYIAKFPVEHYGTQEHRFPRNLEKRQGRFLLKS
ncbi:MAG: carbohydrate kinase family protein [Patescibacteria group bacterium]